MLDTEPTGADGDPTRAADQNDSGVNPDAGPTAEAAPPARTRRRRATAAATIPDAGTPVAGEPAAATAEAPVAAPPRKRAPRKAAPKAEVETSGAETVAETPAAAPVKRARTRRTAAPAEPAGTQPAAAPAEAAAAPAQAAAAPVEAAAAPVKAVAAPAAGPPNAASGVTPGPDAAPDTAPDAAAEKPAPAKRVRSRRAATSPAGSPPATEAPAAPAAADVPPDVAASAADVPPDAAASAGEVSSDVAVAAAAPAGRRRSRAAAGTPEAAPATETPTGTAGAPTSTPTAGTPTATTAPTATSAPASTGTGTDTPAGPGTTTTDGSPFGTAAVAEDEDELAGTEDLEPPVTAEPLGTAEPIAPTATAPFADPAAEAAPRRARRRATSPETTPPPAPAVMFVAPTEAEAPAPRRRSRAAAAAEPETESPALGREAQAAPEAADDDQPAPSRRRRRSRSAEAAEPVEAEVPVDEPAAELEDETDENDDVEDSDEDAAGARRRRRRGRRGRGRNRGSDADDTEGDTADGDAEGETGETAEGDAEESDEDGEDRPSSRRRRRRRRRGGNGGDSEDISDDDPPDTVVHVREKPQPAPRERTSSDDEVRGVRGSTRLEAKRQRRRDGRDTGRRRPPILTESEFLARREAVDRVMVVRQRGDRTQIAVLEDDILVEHYVTKASSTSYAGNVYLGRVQNVLPSMEAAFVDIGKGRNAVLYAGEVNWDVAGLEGRARSIEHALKSGDNIVVQVTKDPIGHKGARLTSQVSLPGRYLVYVPNGSMTGISRKLPDTERSRLKDILRRIVPDDAGVIIRTAAEGASEDELTRDVERLKAQWAAIQQKASQTKSAPTLLYSEPDLELRVVRDVFNEDFTKLVVSGEDAWEMISQYVDHVAPDLAPRLSRYAGGGDAFHDLRIDEQLLKGLDRKVYLPSGGSLVIDRTEAMTVVDVNTGKFVGQGGNLEQTVTRNNLEAAEEIVRQLRLRDIGGIIVIDFIDMVLESNRDLVLRRLTECLGRDRTKHQVAEVTSLGLVQMTRKRVGQGLLEAFSEPCPHCNGRGVMVHTDPVDENRKKQAAEPSNGSAAGAGNGAAAGGGRGRRGRRGAVAEAGPPPTPALLAGRPAPAPGEALDDAGDLSAEVAGDGALDDGAPGDGALGDGALGDAAPTGAAPDGAAPGDATPAEVDVASEDHRLADRSVEAVDTVVAVEPEADVTVQADQADPPPARGGRTRSRRGSRSAATRLEPAAPAGMGPLESVGAGSPAGQSADPLAGSGLPAAAGGPPAAGSPAGVGSGGAEATLDVGTTTPPTEAATASEIAVATTTGPRTDGPTNSEPPAAGQVTPAPEAGPVGSVPEAGPAPAVPATSAESATAVTAVPVGSAPVAGSNGVVDPYGSNGEAAPAENGNGAAPRRRRRAASRPAGPPQPVHSD